ncbi:MAG: FadR family transcriptional regulator [Clostridiaceae bacterium]|nr:FadR family transcriptional regulator [Clostridiaceae bacterium]
MGRSFGILVLQCEEEGIIIYMGSGLSSKIFDKIRKDIINGVYPVGSKLPTERELAVKHMASRFAVREAIAMLSQNGFTETHPQSGTFIKDFYNEGSLDALVQSLCVRRVIDRQTLNSLLKFRFVTETDAAKEAASRITTEDINYLTANLKKKEENLTNFTVLTECDYDFHFRIITASANVISKLTFQSFKPIYSFFAAFFYSIPGSPKASLELNLKLLVALKRKDSQASYEAMADILKHAERKVYESIDEKENLIILNHDGTNSPMV